MMYHNEAKLTYFIIQTNKIAIFVPIIIKKDFMFNFFNKKAASKLFYNTDIHSHILPGVDHGSRDIATSIELLKDQIGIGISNFIFTSHVTETTFENTPESLKASYDILTKAIKDEGLDIKTAFSAEYRLDEYSLGQFAENKIVPMPNDFILIENSFQQELLGLDDILFDIQIKGFRPILAHPERYKYYGYRHQRYKQLHDAGILFQTNILSFAGYFGSQAYENAKWLLEQDYIDFLGSDIHNKDYSNSIIDFLSTKEYRKIEAKLKDRILNDTAFDF